MFFYTIIICENMPDMKSCPYRGKSFADEDLCILDPDHLAMEHDEFRKYVAENIEKSPEKRHYWEKYFKVVTIVRKKCPHLDRAAIYDKEKRIAWFPELKESFELIPDASIGPKCRCLYPNKYEE